jgi:hypothetical protein
MSSATYRADNIFANLFVQDLYVGNTVPGNAYHLPVNDGTTNQILATDGNGHLSFVNNSNVVGPGSSTDKAVVRWNGTTGTLLENSTAVLTDTGQLTISGLILGSLTYPSTDGTNGQAITTNGSGVLSLNTVGNVTGPVSSTDKNLVRWNGTTGKIVQNSTATLSDTGQLNVSTLISAGLTYPIADGTNGQAVTTNGSGILSLVSLSNNVTSGIMTTVTVSNIGVNDHIQFSVIDYKGINITLDTTSPYSNATNTASIGRFTLKGGHTYFLDTFISGILFSLPAGYITVNWYNSDTNTNINTSTIPATPNTTGVMYGCSGTGFNPVSDTRVEVRLIAVNLLTNISRAFAKIIQTG